MIFSFFCIFTKGSNFVRFVYFLCETWVLMIWKSKRQIIIKLETRNGCGVHLFPNKGKLVFVIRLKSWTKLIHFPYGYGHLLLAQCSEIVSKSHEVQCLNSFNHLMVKQEILQFMHNHFHSSYKCTKINGVLLSSQFHLMLTSTTIKHSTCNC